MAKRFRRFVADFSDLVRAVDSEERLLEEGSDMLRDLISSDSWLPRAFTQPSPENYLQHLLYCDPQERFSVVGFVWGPKQFTPIHDHKVWGLIGMLRGREGNQRYEWNEANQNLDPLEVSYLEPREIDTVSPRSYDIHRVWNDLDDETSISIHVYGGNVGTIHRNVYAVGADGDLRREFVSGYSNDLLPNFWQA